MRSINLYGPWLVPAAAALLLLAACRESASTDPAPETGIGIPTATSTPAAAAPAPQPVTSIVAIFDGTLPCADCGGIDTHLVLQRDELGRNSYTLRQLYQNETPGKPFTSAGTWRMDTAGTTGAALIHLDSGRPGDRMTLRVVDERSLVLVAPSGDSAPSGLDYALVRTSGELDLRAVFEQRTATTPTITPATP